MKERLERLLTNLDKSALIRHAELIKGQKVTMSDPFSAGQYWICFEMIADDGSLVIARVRLPRHPDIPTTVSEEDELYSIACEVATMDLVRQKVPAVRVPNVYAYEGPGSAFAAQAGAIYMLLEGFYGNTLQDIQFDLCQLPVSDSLLVLRPQFIPFRVSIPATSNTVVISCGLFTGYADPAGLRSQLKSTSSPNGRRYKRNWPPWFILRLDRSPLYRKLESLSLASSPLLHLKVLEVTVRFRVRRNTSRPLRRPQLKEPSPTKVGRKIQPRSPG